MPNTLQDFIETIKTRGTARLNRFTVQITNPATIDVKDQILVELYCEQAILPSISFASQPVRTYGEQREVVYDRTFETLSLTFILDTQFIIKEYFDSWMNKIIDPGTRLSGYYEEYVRNMKIITQDTNNNNTYETQIYEAYPKTVGAINLDHNSKDIAKLQVTFNYKYHTNKRYNTLSNNTSIPRLYYNDFTQFQQIVNSALATNQIERQGQITGRGIPSEYING